MRALPMVLLLVGCGPGLRLEEIDGVGGVSSATWFEWDREVDGDHDVWHEFVLSSDGGLCKDLQEMVPRLADAYADYASDAAADPANACDRLEDYFLDAAEITEPLFKRELTLLSLTLRDPHDDADDDPPEDTYDQGFDNDDPYFLGTLSLWESNPYAEMADAVGDCGSLDDDLQDAIDDVLTRWEVDRGDVEAEERGGDAYFLALDGDLEDDDGDDAGAIEARGTFGHCLVEYEGWFELL